MTRLHLGAAACALLFAACADQPRTLLTSDGGVDLTTHDPDLAHGAADLAPELTGCAYTYLTYDQPGPDGVWGTADDLPAGGIVLEFDDTLNLVRERFLSGAGPDQAWGTTDDLESQRYVWTHATVGGKYESTFRGYFGFGDDGLWGTSDDQQTSSATRVSDDKRMYSPTEQVDYAPGPDGKWGTADDPVIGHDHYGQPNADGNWTWATASTSPGPDQAWGTADDPISFGHEIRYGATGEARVHLVHTGTGPDHLWNTADDVINPGWISECSIWSGWRMVSGPGADGLWGTDDDPVTSVTRLQNAPSCGALAGCGVVVL